jgi:RNA polymerase sigma-70 factor (ECF subfamily)
VPSDEVEVTATAPDPAHEVALADSVGVALHLVLDRLSPRERVAFVLHDSLGFEHATIADVLGTTPVVARALATRAPGEVRQPAPEDRLAGWEVVDAFMAAARGGDLDRLVRLLAPDAEVAADAAAVAAGTPERVRGRGEVAAFFDGSAHAALPVAVEGRPAAAWYHRGEARVLFDFTLVGGLVQRITFRAEPALLAQVRRREGPGGPRRGGGPLAASQDVARLVPRRRAGLRGAARALRGAARRPVAPCRAAHHPGGCRRWERGPGPVSRRG